MLPRSRTASTRPARTATRRKRQREPRPPRSVMSAIKSNRGEGETPPSPSLLDEAYGFLSSVKFAIFLLSFIAVSSVFGTLVKQQGRPEEYLSVFSESTYAIIRFLSLDDVFR